MTPYEPDFGFSDIIASAKPRVFTVIYGPLVYSSIAPIAAQSKPIALCSAKNHFHHFWVLLMSMLE